MRTVETISHYAAGLARENLADAHAMAVAFNQANIRPDAVMMPYARFLCDAIACTQAAMDGLKDASERIRHTGWYVQEKPDLEAMAQAAIDQAQAIWDAYRLDSPRNTAQIRDVVEQYLACVLRSLVADIRYESRDIRNIMFDAVSQLQDEGLAPPACAVDMPLARRGIVRLDAFAPVTLDAAKAAMADYFSKQARAVMGLE